MRRVLGAGVATVLLASVMAAPAAAGASTRWVDDDGNAGPSDCNGRARAVRTIQPAIDASDPDDRVKVCPGTYVGHLDIMYKPGLRLVSVKQGKAVLHRGSITVRVSDSVQIKGFTMVIPSNVAGVVGCGHGTNISVIDAQRIRIEDNVITNAGRHTRCRGGGGIFFDRYGGGVIRRNTIIDGGGIGGFEAGIVEIRANRILSHHSNDHSKGGLDGMAAISFTHRGTLVIVGNTIEGPPGATEAGDMPAYGIELRGTDAVIRDNRVRWVDTGIALDSDSYGLKIIDNDVRYGSGTGIHLDVARYRVEGDVGGPRVAGNVVRGFAGPGILAVASGGSVITGNDFRHNDADGTIDCVQVSLAPGSQDQPNQWTGNLGDGSDPEGICTPPA